MDTNKKTIAAFDFDGTLTLCDTFSLFIIHSKGWLKFIGGMLILSPIIFAYLLRLLPNYKAKQILFSYFFRGMPYDTFRKYGVSFTEKIELIKNQAVYKLFLSHKELEHDIYIISASIYEWIHPWADKHDIKNILATEVEIDSQKKLTGKFITKNCNGEEKVKRLVTVESVRESYYLYAYGNSKGDIPLLKHADTGKLFKNKQKFNGIRLLFKNRKQLFS